MIFSAAVPADPPSTVGRYRIVTPLGEGRLGRLYLAFDPRLDREVALRLVPPLPDNVRGRLERALRTRVALRHARCAALLDFGDDEGHLYYVREFVPGQTILDAIKTDTSVPLFERVRWMEDVCEALDSLGRSGIMDLDPGDVIVAHGRIMLLDTGLHNALDWGTVSIDPSYSAPETLSDGERDQRSDIFVAGALLYELVTNEKAFGAGTAAEIAQRVLSANWNRDAAIPTSLLPVIERALRVDPLNRYRTFDEFRSVLERVRLALEETAVYAAPASAAPLDLPTSSVRYPDREPEPQAAAPVDVEAPRRIDDNVRFTVYRPAVMAPRRRYPLLFFTHLAERRPDAPADEPDPSKQVEADAANTLGTAVASFPRLVQDAGVGIPHEALLQIKPSVPGLVFNPPEYSFLWIDPVHKATFTVHADPSLEGRTARGSIEVRMGAIPVALITIAIPIEVRAPAQEPPVHDVAAPYRRIFASYSHRDSAIVKQFESYARGIGDSYMRDVVDLRAGEIWNDRLLELIDAADVFQLFWSTNSMESPFVRREWEHALTVNRPQFVRPLYWERPFPEREGLPPPELKARHFASVAIEDDAADARAREEARRRRALDLFIEDAGRRKDRDLDAAIDMVAEAASLRDPPELSRLQKEPDKGIAAKKAEEPARREAEARFEMERREREAAEAAQTRADVDRRRNYESGEWQASAPASQARHDWTPPALPSVGYNPYPSDPSESWRASLPPSRSSRTPLWGIGILVAIVVALTLFFSRC